MLIESIIYWTMGNNDKLRQDYINSLDSFIADNPVVNGLDTLKFRDFLIGLVEHESSFNPNARQGSYYGWYQTDKHDSDPYKQHLNAFNHLSDLFKNTITQADIDRARKLGINDATLMLKYWNQGNRVNNYIWNNQDNQDGLGTKISEYGNDLTMPLDVYDYAMKNIYGDYTVKSGDSWFNIQKRVRIPGRDYNTAGKDLWNMQDTTGIYGLLKPGQKFSFGDNPNVNNSILNINKIKVLSNKVNPDWYADMIKRRDTNNLNQSLYYQKGGSLIYKEFTPEEIIKQKEKKLNLNDLLSFNNSDRFPVEAVKIYRPSSIEFKQSSIKTDDSKPKGLVIYEKEGMDVGNMQELIDKMVEEGVRFKVTSGRRPGATTKQGKRSYHADGYAVDIVPIEGETFDDILSQIKASPTLVSYMKNQGFGIIDERSKEMLAKTGGTGAHFHIGKDLLGQTQFKYLIG